MNIVGLLTDFGPGEYVSIMKAVIINTCQFAPTFIDITHLVQPQNILQASWILSTSVPYFPPNSIIVAVVDPGVGGSRASLLIETENYVLIAPNNGILTHLIRNLNIIPKKIYELDVSKSSATFQGRDVFAVAAANYLKDKSIDGKIFTGGIELLPSYTKQNQFQVVSIDHFGNLISDLKRDDVLCFSDIKKIKKLNEKGQSIVVTPVKTYEEGLKKHSEVVVIIGSNNTVEVSVVNGDAAKTINSRIGDVFLIE
ncbi:DUF62-containing protein [Entamoeba marina]